MNDKELLELAAKAAGIDSVYCYETRRNCLRLGNKKIYVLWRPLTDDGDALRLAVKLEMEIGINLKHAWAIAVGQQSCQSEVDENPCAATRRAIVRAAAEIGKTK